MDLLKEFLAYIKKEQLFQQNDRLLITVSGGVDSVVLCELCNKAGYDFEIAHCNFQLRAGESDLDESFVEQLAKNYKVTFHVKRFETEKYASEQKVSTQVAARELRYNWFNQLINNQTNKPINYILTAHHANDNIETLLMNFFKGTGIRGLQGIQAKSGKRNKIVRPLLFAKKEELLQFADEHNLTFREDSSNKLDKYTRNYFRNQLIPSLQETYPQVENNLLDNINRFNEINVLYQQAIEANKKKLLFVKGNEVHIPVLKLLKTPALHSVIFEIMKDFGFAATQTAEIAGLLSSESGKFINSNSHRVLRNRNWLIISKLGSKEISNFIIESSDESIIFFDQKLNINQINKPSKIDSNPAVALLDATDITFPLLLRKWKKGDYFYPLGMKKKKKLSRFFIDQKLSLLQKENTWVIEMNKKIIWVVGHRIDDRFKLTEQTTTIYKITCLSAK